MTSPTDAAPYGQQIASEDRSSSDHLERLQRQRRLLGEAITQSMTQSTSSPSLLSARSEETAAFFVQAATKKILRRPSSEGGAVLDTDSAQLPKQVSFFPMVQVHWLQGKHELLTDRDNEKSLLGSSSR